MCSRYGIDEKVLPYLNARYGSKLEARLQAGDIHPGDTAPVLIAGNERPCIMPMTWGMRRRNIGQLVINARKETLWEKPMFRQSIKYRRCLLPATRFYEWDADKHKVTFHGQASFILFFAGIYRDDGNGSHFAVITTPANDVMRPVHDRMPVIVPENFIMDWLRHEDRAKAILDAADVAICRDESVQQMSLWK